MFSIDQLPNPREDEKIVLFLRRHIFVFIVQCCLYGFLAIIPLLLYFFWTQFIGPLDVAPNFYAVLVLSTSIYYLFVSVFLYTAFMDYFLDVWILTNNRIISIEQKGLFSRFIAEHDLDVVQDVSVEMQGILPTFLKYGDIHIQTAGATQYFIFKEIPYPFDVSSTVGRVVKEYKEKVRGITKKPERLDGTGLQ